MLPTWRESHLEGTVLRQIRSISSGCAALFVAALVFGCTSEDGGSGGSDSTGTGALGSGANASGGSSTGGAVGGTGAVGTGGLAATGGASASGGAATTGGASGTGGSTASCDDAGLVWKTANKTNYTSYPEPGSVECVEYNGCMWAGWFAGCASKQEESWVQSHNIAALFPNFEDYQLHDICIRSGEKTMIVTVYDTCGDDDCEGCCTQNKGSKDALVDLESFTNERWGLPDGAIEWADLGPTTAGGCN